MTVNELTTKCGEQAKASGWWSKEASELEIHMLIVSEVAEATEEVRNKRPSDYVDLGNRAGVRTEYVHPFLPVAKARAATHIHPDILNEILALKPEGEAVELADAVIRVMGYFAKNGWDLEDTILRKLAYNATRGHRHGGKVI